MKHLPTAKPENAGKERLMNMLTVNDVLEHLVISRATLYRLIKLGRFPTPIKVGNSTRFLVSDLKEWTEQNRRTG